MVFLSYVLHTRNEMLKADEYLNLKIRYYSCEMKQKKKNIMEIIHCTVQNTRARFRKKKKK